MNETDGIKIPGHNLFLALTDNLAGKDARICLRSRSMVRIERRPFRWRNRRNRWDIVRWVPLTGAPECFVLAANFFPTFLPDAMRNAKLRVEDALKFPIVKYKRIGGVVQQSSCPKQAKREGMKGTHPHVDAIWMAVMSAMRMNSIPEFYG
jgi:hypothetical protein